MAIKLKKLMFLERILLEIDTNHKFELDFGEAYKLHTYLCQVGKITNYAFLIQDEFNRKFNNVDELKKYHDKIMESSVDFDYDEIIDFISVVHNRFNDEKIEALISNVMSDF